MTAGSLHYRSSCCCILWTSGSWTAAAAGGDTKNPRIWTGDDRCSWTDATHGGDSVAHDGGGDCDDDGMIDANSTC